MKNKLELRHLFFYLPYGLKCEILDYQSDYVGEKYLTMKGYYLLNDKPYFNFHNGRDYAGKNTTQFKPILIPLSDFKEMIIGNIKIELELSHNQLMEFLGFMDGEIKLENITLGLHEAMCKKHIDFNKLIEAGLAIDINTL